MISQSAEYSLRAVLCLAAAQPREPTLTTQQIALRTKVPAGYLSKIMQQLARAGIVTSQRGINGGFKLAIEPAQLTLLDVVAAIEPSRRIGQCPLGHAQDAPKLCPLHRRLDAAACAIEAMLQETTIAGVLHESLGSSHCHQHGCGHRPDTSL